MEAKIQVQGRDVSIIGEHAEKLSVSKEFGHYIASLKKDITVESVSEEWAWFSKKEELIFAIFYVAYVDADGAKRGEIFFFRSNSVAVFFVVCDMQSLQRFAVLVEQMRIPAGGSILEIPAGSCEIGEEHAYTMVREIKEEVGLYVQWEDIHLLGDYYFSPGACCEKITLYYCEHNCSSAEIRALQNRIAGLRHHGEKTKVTLVPLEDFEKLPIRDAKSRLAFELYKNILMQRRI